MRGLQKYARNLILTVAFGGQTKTGQKIAARWAGSYLADSLKSQCEISFHLHILPSPHQVDMKNVVKCWKDFLWYSTTLETHRLAGRIQMYHY